MPGGEVIEQGSYEETPPPSSFASSTTLAEAGEPDQAGSEPRYQLRSAKADGCEQFNKGYPGMSRMVHESAQKLQKGKGKATAAAMPATEARNTKKKFEEKHQRRGEKKRRTCKKQRASAAEESKQPQAPTQKK
ncbi:hypothetical protein J1614_009836 [Plenodomus biglobosus]|nr:hypothetical protein J1614_009836 [Plenodomus biglobosus]